MNRSGTNSNQGGGVPIRKRLPTLVSVLTAVVVVAAACGGDGGDEAAEAPSGDANEGKTVFVDTAEPTCGSCHTLADAGTNGTIGPNLDERAPSADEVRTAVEDGPGAMPSFADQLSEEQIDAVAQYVSEASGGGG
jgi:cytochrome c6